MAPQQYFSYLHDSKSDAKDFPTHILPVSLFKTTVFSTISVPLEECLLLEGINVDLKRVDLLNLAAFPRSSS